MTYFLIIVQLINKIAYEMNFINLKNEVLTYTSDVINFLF